MVSDAFDMSKSKVGAESLAEFIASPVMEDLKTVPGIKEGNEALLRYNGIKTTHQLIGCFLSHKDEDYEAKKVCDDFWNYLRSIGINSNRNTIVNCIAQKVNIMIPGMFPMPTIDE